MSVKSEAGNLLAEGSMAKKKKASKKPGLYANIHKAQERAKHGGRPVRKKGAKGAPTDAAFKKAKKTAKKKTARKKK